jgi:hypothetical protein
MPLSVIGAGFGRTGTLSLKLALERLGFGPCHHMLEVFARPEQAAAWLAAAKGQAVDWDTLLAGYASAVDWPSSHFWRELSTHAPAAKVVLTARNADAWFRSISQTIGKLAEDEAAPPDPQARAVQEMARYVVMERTFGGRLADPAHAKAVYRRHVEAVTAALPPERLLVFDVADGWEPLCRFLGQPIPEAPFPRTNSTEEFLQRRADRLDERS